jgi:hypothetical protein
MFDLALSLAFAPLIIPTLPLPRTVFVALNYLVVASFVVLNAYITYQIVRAYGPVLFSLFRGGEA